MEVISHSIYMFGDRTLPRRSLSLNDKAHRKGWCLGEFSIRFAFLPLKTLLFAWCAKLSTMEDVSFQILTVFSGGGRAAHATHTHATHTSGIIQDRLLRCEGGSERTVDKVIYVGDGGGDYCPALRLRYVLQTVFVAQTFVPSHSPPAT